jgi:TetR/AcrR family transcriptional regulator, transcriptional repressor for nem operon
VAKRDIDARERLIEGARDLLWDRGYLGTSPTALWRAAGVGQGSMYHHFAGKHDLVLAAEERTVSEANDEMQQILGGGGSAYERIERYLLKERDALRGCPVGRLVADPEISADAQLREPVRNSFAVLHECLVAVVEEGKAGGEFCADLDATQTAYTLSAVIQGGYTLARAEDSVAPFEGAIRGALELLRLVSRADPRGR